MRLSHFSYVQTEDVPHGKVIIVGMMEDGPTGTPFTLKENGSATFLLGDNEVSRTYELLASNGTPVENIILFRLNGVPAQAEIAAEQDRVLILQSTTSHDEDKNVDFTVSEEGVALISNYTEEAINSGKRKNFKRTYLFKDNPYMADLAQSITADAALGVHNIIAQETKSVPSSILAEEIGVMAFNYGDSEQALTIKDANFPEGTVDDEDSYLKDYWEKFYFHLLGPDFDGESSSKLLDVAAEVIYFPDVPIEQSPEIAILAGRVAEQKTEAQSVLCTALFRTSAVPEVLDASEVDYLSDDGTYYDPNTDEDILWEPKAEQEKFVNHLINLFTEEEKDYPEMNHVQIVVGEERTSFNERLPGAAYHLVHLINEELTSTTNKELVGFERINSILDKNQIDKLSAKGYICIVDSIRRNAVTSKVKTPYNSSSLKEEFYFRKILSYIIYDIKNMLDRYIGQNLTMNEDIYIEDLLNEYLFQYQEERLIESFNLGERVEDPANHSSNINIEIIMYGVVEKIKGSVQLNEQGWEVDLWNL